MVVGYRDVVDAWDRADPRRIHPSRDESEQAYWDSGREQAAKITAGLRAAGVHVGGSVLDYGCGDGRVAVPMAAQGWRVIAADTSPRMVDRLRRNAGDTVTVAPVDSLPVVDAAYCLAVLIHHDRASAARIVATIAGAVRDGGLLVLDWPTSVTPQERDSWIGVTTWAPAERAAVAGRLGLVPADVGLPWSTWRRL